MNKITIQDICLSYGDTPILKNVNQEIQEGEIFAFVGPSGCGKTLLLKILSGLTFPDTGQVLYHDEVVHDYNKTKMLDYHKKCGFVFQNAALVGNMSIYENLSLYYTYHTRYTEDEIRMRVQDLLDTFKFKDDVNNRPASLSTGERMVVSIMRAVSHDPEIVFWDEPLVNLDNATTTRVKKLMLELKEKGATQVLATYDGRLALSLADRLSVLDEGSILMSGTQAEIKAWDDPVVRHILNLD